MNKIEEIKADVDMAKELKDEAMTKIDQGKEMLNSVKGVTDEVQAGANEIR